METEENAPAQKPDKKVGVRHFQYLLYMTLIIAAYGMRISFNVAIIAMISKEKHESYPTYPEWSDKKQLLLSGFFWGYICCQVIAGQLAKIYGAKYPLLTSLTISSVITISFPLICSQFGYKGALACRVIQGLTQGFIYPSIQSLLGIWAPLSERTKYGSIVWSGNAIGNVIAMPVAGAIAASPVGWPVIFYFFGVAGLCWCALWYIFGASSPEDSKWISNQEKKWIQYELGEYEKREDIPTPWKSIFTSVPFYALLITHCGQDWGFWMLLTEIPTYMSSVLKFDIASNGLLSTLPYLIMFIVNILMSQIAHILLARNILTVNFCRKLFNSIGMYVPAVSLLVLTFVGPYSKDLAIFLLVLAVASNAGVHLGMSLNHIDLSPVHSGTLTALTNSIASILAVVAPLTIDAISSLTGYSQEDQALWNVVFYLTTIIFIGVAKVFIFLGSTKLQPWNSPLTRQKQLSLRSVNSIDIKSKIKQLE